MKLFKKSDGLADVVANRFENGGGDMKKAPGIVSRTCSKIQHILYAWKDNRAAKKREKNEKSVDAKTPSSTQKTKEPDLKPAKDILGKSDSKFLESNTTKTARIRHWTWKHYMVILGLPTLTISPVVYFGVRKFLRKPVVVNNTPPPQVDFPLDSNHPMIVEIAKTEQQTTGTVSFIDTDIYLYAIDRFPDKVVDENTKVYYGATEYWRKATGKTADQKLKSTLLLIHETFNQDNTVRSDFETLSNLWYNDSLQDLYSSELISEVTIYIKKTPGREEYKKHLQEAITAIRLNQQYIERLHDGFGKIVVDSMTRDIPGYKEKKAIVDAVASLKEEYDKERAIYDEQIKLGNWRAKRPKAINIKDSERDIYNTYYKKFKILSSDISKKIYEVILRDTLSESGKTHLALLEQMRRTRGLKWVFEKGQNLPIKTLEEKISIDLPKDPDEEPSTSSEVVQSPDSSSGSQSQGTQDPQSPQKVKQ